MNEPSLHDHRREAEEADDLAKEHDEIEARLQFDSWVQRNLDRIDEEGAHHIIESAMDLAMGDLYEDMNGSELAIALFRIYSTHGEDLAANRKLIDLLDPYMRSAVIELGD